MTWNGEWSLINWMKLVLGLQTILINFPDVLDGRLDFQVLCSFGFCKIPWIFEGKFFSRKWTVFRDAENERITENICHLLFIGWALFIMCYWVGCLVILPVEIAMVLIQRKRIQHFFLSGSDLRDAVRCSPCTVLHYMTCILFRSTKYGIHILPRSYQQCMHHLQSISFVFVLFCFGIPILKLCEEAKL